MLLPPLEKAAPAAFGLALTWLEKEQRKWNNVSAADPVYDEVAGIAHGACVATGCADEAALRGVATSVDQVRAALLETVDADDVLVGHSLDCDLRALGLAHHACADTALLYGHPRGAPYKKKLKQLAKEFLDREIQDGAHDSAVDARAALDLFALRVARGPAFAGGAEDAFARLARHGCRVCVVGDAATLQRRATGAVSAVRATGAGVAAAAGASNASNAINNVKSYVTNKFEDWTD